jgi:hypothetical protein
VGRRAAATRLDGSRSEVSPADARRELARRYLHIFGPATPDGFARWSGIGPRYAVAAFDALRTSLTRVRTPIGDAWILAEDEPTVRSLSGPAAPARLLPSGDPFLLLQGVDRELLVPDAVHRRDLWTPRVWPGGVLVEGELVGTWRRADATLTVTPWRRLSRQAIEAVEVEASSLPLAGVAGRIMVRWEA